MRRLALGTALLLTSVSALAIDTKVYQRIPEEQGFYVARASFQKVAPTRFRIWEAAVPERPVESAYGTIDEIYWFAEYDCAERTKTILQRNAYYRNTLVPQDPEFERPPPGVSYVRPGTMSARVLMMCDGLANRRETFSVAPKTPQSPPR